MKRLSLLVFSSFFSLVLHSQSFLDDPSVMPFEGFLDFFYLSDQDEIFMEVKDLDSDFLYVSSLREGVGSNDLGLDRGQIGESRIVRFQKAGNKLLLIQPNLRYRAITDNALEKKSIEEAFAKSVLFGFPIFQQTANGYLINLTPFLMQDAHDVAKTLNERNQGAYAVDLSRSALNKAKTKAFPKNVDFDVMITLTGYATGNEIRSVTPDADFVTVYQHHSFVELPDNNYKPRKYHPSSGSYSTSFMNYSAPIDENMEVEYLVRHRLEKRNPTASISEAIEPIIYYLDNGTPEPVRSALLEGAQWWNQAFEAIGYKNAFQVKVLPDSIDPLDIRYNVIQWVHRSTRGWSHGNTVSDPRTGEIIKGHVSLGSLRVRQDFAIAQALSKAPFGANEDISSKLLEFALSRIKQLSAHEVGHTLGFKHNFAASTNDRASVMDYPHPLVKIKDGEIDLSNAYDQGIGSWDKVSVAYAYADFAEDEEERLALILKEAFEKGHKYVTDPDSRPPGGANATGHLWDNGKDPIIGLESVLSVRSKAINQFGTDNIKEGDELAKLEDLFVLLYYFHRYQTEAVVKLIGGVDYGYGLKGEQTGSFQTVSGISQKAALKAILKTISVSTLMVPENKLQLFIPRSYGDRGRESLKSKTGPVFDPISAATTAADLTTSLLLHPERISRLILQKSLDESQLGLTQMLDDLIKTTLEAKHSNPYQLEIQESINSVIVSHLIRSAQDSRTYPQAKLVIDSSLEIHLEKLKKVKNRTIYEEGRIKLIEAYFDDPGDIEMIEVPKIPDGSPIGSHACGSL